MPRKKMKLTEENYYSQQANVKYWSVSQYKSFLACEAATMAQLRGGYTPPVSKAMLVGSFVDHHVEGTLQEFINEHPEIYTKKNLLRAEYRKANEIIKIIDSDKDFNKFLSGEKQKILSFEMFGVLWKIKIDSFVEGICIDDLKVVAKIDRYIINYLYDIQGAVYQAGVEANGYGRLPFYLSVISKENPPRKKVIQIRQERLDMRLNEIGENMPHLIDVKNGLVEPKWCGKCPYCAMKQKTQIIDYESLIG